METAQYWDRLAKNQPAEIVMFQSVRELSGTDTMPKSHVNLEGGIDQRVREFWSARPLS